MKRQVEMEQRMLMAHRIYMDNLQKSLDLLEDEIEEAREMSQICTDEWCSATEGVIDDLHKSIYSISEPRWLTEDDSLVIKKLRGRVKDLYMKYRSANA